MRVRRWSVNGRFLTQKMTGVQRYAHEIVRQFDALMAEKHPLAEGLEIELLLPVEGLAPCPFETIQMRVATGLRGHLWEQITLPRRAGPGLVNLCNTAPVLHPRSIVCIHDLNVIESPASYSHTFRLLYGALIPMVARRAARVTTVSRYSASRISALGPPLETIAILPNGCDHALSWPVAPSPELAGAAGPRTVVVLGSGAPHKNVGMLIGLAGRMQEAGLKLVLVGSRDASVFQVVDVAGAGNVIAVGRLSDGELAALLADCLCLAFPSFIEGFGLPPLEAMARGCPVVSSDRASLPEVCGDAVLYADPDKPESWLAAFARLADDAGLRGDLIVRGQAQARRFSWRASALGYLAAMAELDGIGA